LRLLCVKRTGLTGHALRDNFSIFVD
jgi:hypothetical protein